MRFDVVTIFPKFFEGFTTHGIVRRARERNLVTVNVHDLRDFTYGRHHVVDDRPFGGDDGMVLKPEPLFRAVEYLTHGREYQPLGARDTIEAAPEETVSVVVLTPQGRPFTQAEAVRLSAKGQVVLIAGVMKESTSGWRAASRPTSCPSGITSSRGANRRRLS
jgi:tRNA (guanine37-N1)-methyltransferase